MGVVGAAVARAVVDVVGPGVPVAGAVGEDGEVVAQAFVAGPAEADGAVFAGLFGDGGLAGVGGERVVVWGSGRGCRRSRRAARRRRRRSWGRGRSDRKIGPSGWARMAPRISLVSWLICSTSGRSAATRPSTAARRASVSSSPTRRSARCAGARAAPRGSCGRSRRGGRGTRPGAWAEAAGVGGCRVARQEASAIGLSRSAKIRAAPGQNASSWARSWLASATRAATRSSRVRTSARSASVSSPEGASAGKRCWSVRASSQSTIASKRSSLPAAARKRSRAAATWLGWIASTVIPAASSRPTSSPSGRSIATRATRRAISSSISASMPASSWQKRRSASGAPLCSSAIRTSWCSAAQSIPLTAAMRGPPQSRSLPDKPTARYRGGCS